MKMLEIIPQDRLIDVNVHLSRWPFRQLPHDEPAKLVEKLRQSNVTTALVSSFDAILHQDLSAVNRRLVEECQQYGAGLLVPVGAINLALPGWQDDVEDCVRAKSVVGVRIYPGTHDYPLNDGRFEELCRLCQEGQLLLQIVVRLEDPRTEHARFISKIVGIEAGVEVLKKYPQLKVMLLNPGRDINPVLAGKLIAAENVHFDLGMVEQTGGIFRYLKTVPPERLLFGSHFPFFYLEASLLKLHENELGRHITELIAYKNAERLLELNAGT